MWILDVVPVKKGLPKESLSYFSVEPVADGTVVSVPIRSKNVDGVVIASRDAREEKASLKKDSFSLKKISAIKKDILVPQYVFETATLAAQYYRTTKGTMLNLLVSDFSYYSSIDTKNLSPEDPNTPVPERLVFQSPLEDRISFYRTYIREAFAKKESLMFVCPTIADCELFEEALSRGVADFVHVFHGDISKKQFSSSLKKIQHEDHGVVIITTPTYASLMPKNAATLIVEHESAGAYITPSVPGYDLRILLEILARTSGRKLIIGDSLLRVETLGRMEFGEFGSVAPVTFRALAPIDLSLIPHGVPEELPPRLRSEQVPALSPTARTIIEKAPLKGAHIFVFSLRTGLATFTRCRDCGTVLLCEHCEAPLVLYAGGGKRVFICNKCKRHAPTDAKCKRCGSWNLAPMGTGTAFVEDEVKRLFPDMPVFRIDRESTTTRAQARKVAAAFTASPSGVLIGTEMALYYTSEHVTDSIIASFDTLFNIPSYRTNERIIDLFFSIAERTQGKLHVQTKHEDEEILKLIRSNNYASWYKKELDERKEYRYPPYATILKIQWRGKESERPAAEDYIREVLAPFSPDIFETHVVTKGKKEAALNAIIRPQRDEWSVWSLLEGRGLSDVLKQALAQLPKECSIWVNPDNLL